MMSKDVIQDWTDTIVELNGGDTRDVRYQVFTDGDRRYQEIRDNDGTLLRKQELPQGVGTGKISLETSVRFALLELANA